MTGRLGRRGPALRALLDGLHHDPGKREAALAAVRPELWPAVIGLANDHLLGPALAAAAAEGRLSAAMPGDVCTYLHFIHRCNAVRNGLIRRQAIELVGAFNERGIRPLLLKGILTLFADRGRDPATRMMSDIDVAVPPSLRDPAEAVLHALGYRTAERYPEGHHAVGEFRRNGDPAAVDLHLELIDQRYALPAAAVFAAARPSTEAGIAFLRPAPTDRLLHALLHAQTHHLGHFYRGHVSLGQLHDLVTVAVLQGGETDWRDIDGRLRRHRLTPVLDSYLLLAGQLLGLPWPLDRPAGRAGRYHAAWCVAHLRLPGLERLAVPVGNLRMAFAWHRMRALYGNSGSPISWRSGHAVQYLKRHDMRQAIGRLFR